MAARAGPLEWLVVSIGNPAPYANSMHSAGHFALRSLQNAVTKANAEGANDLKIAFAQSSAYMNVSGPSVLRAWKKRLGATGCQPADLGLIVLHDELSLAFGQVAKRPWESSFRGHNGLRSISKVMGSNTFTNMPWWKMGVGIGRPVSRSPEDVSEYVLRNISQAQQQKLETVTGPEILQRIQALHKELAS